MASFLLDFSDLDPSLDSSQDADYENLDEATLNVIAAIRDIVADHVRHGRVVTLRSITIRDEAQNALREVTVADAIAGLLPAALAHR